MPFALEDLCACGCVPDGVAPCAEASAEGGFVWLGVLLEEMDFIICNKAVLSVGLVAGEHMGFGEGV